MLAGERQQRVRHHVGDHRVGRDPLAAGQAHARDAAVRGLHAGDQRAGPELAAELGQVADERVGQRLRAAARAGPADRVPEQVQVGDRDRRARPGRRHVAVTAAP